MGGNGKLRRWKISLHRSKPDKKDPPNEFLCPISNSLMFDPVVVSSGQTFERLAVEVCRDLRFTPTLPDGSRPDFGNIIPNLALKSSISSWCSKSGKQLNPPEYSQIEESIRASTDFSSSVGRDSERELLNGVAETPPVLFSHAESELNGRNFYSCSSSEESVIANTSPLLPFTTRPYCFSSTTSPSTSSEFISEDASNSMSGSSSSSEEETLVNKMKSLDVYEQEQAVISLRKTTRTNEDARVALCTPRLLLSLKQLLDSRYSAVQTNATAALVNLSLANVNKIKIVRSGIVPLLIEILKNGFEESQEHAAGAIFSLALEDDNKTAIGVLGALPPLLHTLRAGSHRSRNDAALALYHLTLVQSNRAKLIKLGAVTALLGLLRDSKVARRVVLVVCNLAACLEGRTALLDANAVKVLVAMLSELDSESTRENCVAALHSLSQGSLRFKGLAKDAKAAEALRRVIESGTERAKEKARRVLVALKDGDAEEETAEWDGEEEVDWEGVMKEGVTRARHRVRRGTYSRDSIEF